MAEKQLVQIIIALSFDAKVIIMDEPNTALTDEETMNLFRIINELKEEGVSIIYISHRLEEVLTIADRISVLRDGEHIKTLSKQEATLDEIIRLMVGRDIKDIYPPRNNDKKTIGKTILEAENFSCHDCFTDVSFELREGEILGIAGLQGCGRTELAECLIGARQGSGELQVFGEKFAPRYTAQSIERGLVYIPPDRRWDSIIPDQSIAFNMAISSLKKFNRSGIISEKQIKETAHKQVETLQIKTPSVEQLILKLSGGNQQKVVFSRALVAEPKILILNEPTRGIDVGAKYEIYVLIQELAAEGMGIIFISSELPELMAICDRIMVMWEGKKAGEFDPEQHSKESVLDAMMGGKAQIAV